MQAGLIFGKCRKGASTQAKSRAPLPCASLEEETGISARTT